MIKHMKFKAEILNWVYHLNFDMLLDWVCHLFRLGSLWLWECILK